MATDRTRQKALTLDSGEVSWQSFLDVTIGGRPLALSASRAWRRRIATGREILERALAAGETVYGVSTGVGNNSSRGVDTAGQVAYALSIMEQHGCGVGEPLSPAESRAVVLARLVSLSKGLSAVRCGLLEALAALLNHDISPVMPRWGSVGASGDLTPLSYVAAVLAGQRKAFLTSRLLP